MIPPAAVATTQSYAVDAASVDLIADSIEHPLAVAFSKTSSPNYRVAVDTARRAFKYSEIQHGNTIQHAAVFAAERVQLSRALHLLWYIRGFKSTRVFAGGKLQTGTARIEEVINCYLTAMACDDWRAHCHRVVSDDPFGWDDMLDEFQRTFKPGTSSKRAVKKPPQVTRYQIPCALVALYGGRQAVTEAVFGVSVRDKLQAIGVKRGCAWCPNFKPDDFKTL